jgi:phage-related protein
MGDLWDSVWGGMASTLSTIGSIITETWNAIWGTLSDPGEIISGLIDSIWGGFKGIWNVFAEGLNDVIRWINDKLIGAINDIIPGEKHDIGDISFRVPTLHQGTMGFMPLGANDEGYARVRRLERVPSEQEKRMAYRGMAEGRGRGTLSGVNLTINVGSVDSNQRVREIAREVQKNID